MPDWVFSVYAVKETGFLHMDAGKLDIKAQEKIHARQSKE